MTNTITIKFADKTIEVEEFFFNGEGMAQDTLNTYGFYPDVVETFYSDEDEAKDIFETLAVRKQSLETIETFANENGLRPSDAFGVCFDGFNSEEYQKLESGVSGETALIKSNIRKWLVSKNTGRPPIYGVTMPRVLVRLRPDQLEWVKAQGDNVSQTVRDIIDDAMARDGETLG